MTDIFDCARAQIYHNSGKLSPAQIKVKTGCTHIINGYLFNGKFQPVGWTVIDGKVISRDAYQDWGISIGTDLEYADEVTLARAFVDRKQM